MFRSFLLTVSRLGIAAVKVTISSSLAEVQKSRDFKWMLNAGTVEELHNLEKDYC